MTQGVDVALLLLCTYGQTNDVVRLCHASTFEKVVDVICGKFDGLVPGLVYMMFDISGYNKFKVDCDDDIQNMLCLTKSFGLHHINVLIQLQTGGSANECGAVDCAKHSGVTPNVWLTFDMEGRTDLLPTYCPHKLKYYLSAEWAYGITHVGQCFGGDANEFRTVLAKFAAESGFQYQYVKNDAVRVTIVCKFSTSTGCSWMVHVRVLPSNGDLCVRRFDSLHTYSVTVRTYRNPRTGSKLVSDVIADRVRNQPLTRPADAVFDMKNDYGLDISYRVAWLGVEKARGIVYGDHAMSFDQLRWYSDAIMEKNPNSYINLEFDQKSARFVRYFISFRACIDGSNQCRPLIFLNGTFLKGRFKGNLLATTAKDGNQGLFPVTFAIVDFEKTANWEWFLKQLTYVVDSSRNMTFVSDYNAGLLQSMPIIFPSAHHAFYMLHLQMNLRDRMKYVNATHKSELLRKLRECAFGPTVTCFNQKIEVLKQLNPTINENFMRDLHPNHWANAYFRGQHYGKMWSNTAESFNNWINEARHLPITHLVDTIRGKIMEKRTKCRLKSSKWTGVICPKMKKKLESELQIGRSWIVSQADNNVYEVHSHPSVMVDIIRRTCSCYQWQLNGFPCSHVLVAFQNSGKNVYDSVDFYYRVNKYKASYSGAVFLIPTAGKLTFKPNDYLIAPPIVKRPLGRPKQKRIPSK